MRHLSRSLSATAASCSIPQFLSPPDLPATGLIGWHDNGSHVAWPGMAPLQTLTTTNGWPDVAPSSASCRPRRDTGFFRRRVRYHAAPVRRKGGFRSPHVFRQPCPSRSGRSNKGLQYFSLALAVYGRFLGIAVLPCGLGRPTSSETVNPPVVVQRDVAISSF